MTYPLFQPADCRLLLELISQCTVNPLERAAADPPHRLREAGRAYAEAASFLGFEIVRQAAVDPVDLLGRRDVPRPVRLAVVRDPGFLDTQPSLLLRLGPPRPPEQTVMFNVHLDTVAGYEPPGFDGTVFTGRGAIDAKGPAVALLAGLRGALAMDPGLGEHVMILIQAVGGEEGGALGVYGTRPLVESGAYGRLNVFCEPTGLRYLPRATAAMTARLRVYGHDAIDDRPGEGHNATVLLGYLAQHLAARLPGRVPGTSLCVAGLHTGTQHNRVYGTGDLLLNLSYPDSASGARLEQALTAELASGIERFRDKFRGTAGFDVTAREADEVLELTWDKRGLPALSGGLPGWSAELLEAAGASCWPATEPGFTCDAIWLADVPDAATVVLGPGDLAANHAHASGEFARLADLEAFADLIARLVPGCAQAARQAAEPAVHPAARYAEVGR